MLKTEIPKINWTFSNNNNGHFCNANKVMFREFIIVRRNDRGPNNTASADLSSFMPVFSLCICINIMMVYCSVPKKNITFKMRKKLIIWNDTQKSSERVKWKYELTKIKGIYVDISLHAPKQQRTEIKWPKRQIARRHRQITYIVCFFHSSTHLCLSHLRLHSPAIMSVIWQMT